MSAAYLVYYEGRPHDEDEFNRHYRETHLPIVRRFPGVQSIEVLRGTGSPDDVLYMLVILRWDSWEDLQAALASPARAAAAADRKQNLERLFGGVIRNQVVVPERFL